MSSSSSSSSSSNRNALLQSSVSTASSLMALQLLSRLFTFILNQALLRLASPRAFGTAAIQFELLLSTILFLSREGVRGAVLRNLNSTTATTTATKTRKEDEEKRRRRKIINLTFLPLALGFPLALFTAGVYALISGEDAKSQAYFYPAVAVYVSAALTELLVEPMYNVATSELLTPLRVRAEGLGITAKTLTTFLVLLYSSTHSTKPDLALLAFAGGQLSYSLVVLGVYVSHYRASLLGVPVRDGDGYFDKETSRLAKTMTAQSLVKHFLTEADKVVLAYLSPLKDQGGYAVAVNYGSLIARIIFQPIEETSRVFFSKTLPSLPSPQKHPLTALRTASQTIFTLLSMHFTLAVLLAAFAPPYLHLILPFLLPRQYLTGSSVVSVLGAWVWYVPVLGVNGGLEAFVQSVADGREVKRQSRYMVVFTMIYVSSTLVLYSPMFGLGDAVLVYANIVTLSARIVYAWAFIARFFNRNDAGNLVAFSMPSRAWWLWLGVVGLARVGVEWSASRQRGSVVRHLGVGVVLGVACVVMWWVLIGRRLRGRKEKVV